MKGGFEVVQGALELLQPHEQWEYSTNLGYTSTPQASQNTMFQNTALEGIKACSTDIDPSHDLSEWVDLDQMTPVDEGFETSMEGEMRPRKMAKRGEFNHQFGSSQTSLSSSEVEGQNESCHQRFDDDQGLSLITLLLESAVAISVDNLGEAHRMLLELSQWASPYAPSCAERVAAYFAKSMSSRVINSWLGLCSPLINHKTIHASFQVFNNISPFVKFAHFTSNQAILEAFHGKTRVHIIDLDIMQGLQWPALFHILATRIEGPPHVRMTGMGPTSVELLAETGKQLSVFAKRLGMSFEFQPLPRKIGELSDPSSFNLRHGETLAVHWLHHSLYDATGSDWKTLKLLQDLNPKILTLVQQNLSHAGSFLDRFVSSLHYYSTIFDSLGANRSSDDPSRHTVEHSMLFREINNILAIGGPARSGEDKFKDWRSELLQSGLVQIPMSGNSMAQAQLILNMFLPANGYTLVQGDGTLRLGWKETSLYTASAWTSQSYIT
ncbi:unnamed protein product [Rhodiola kirilowii]